jgi:hypothetical protein
MINFWATWCSPCRREIPLLKTLRHERAGDGLEIVGIAVDFREAVQKYAREMGIDYPVLVGEQDALEAIAAFGMDTVFPFTVFADRQGRIVTLKIGEMRLRPSIRAAPSWPPPRRKSRTECRRLLLSGPSRKKPGKHRRPPQIKPSAFFANSFIKYPNRADLGYIRHLFMR